MIYICIYIYICVCVYACMHVYIYIYTFVCVFLYIYVYMCNYMCIYIYLYVPNMYWIHMISNVYGLDRVTIVVATSVFGHCIKTIQDLYPTYNMTGYEQGITTLALTSI